MILLDVFYYRLNKQCKKSNNESRERLFNLFQLIPKETKTTKKYLIFVKAIL
jgi:hypothetical protein